TGAVKPRSPGLVTLGGHMAVWFRRAPQWVVLPLLLILAGLLPPGPPSRAVASAPAAVLGDEDAQNVFIDSGRDNQAAVPPAPSTTGELIRPSPTPSRSGHMAVWFRRAPQWVVLPLLLILAGLLPPGPPSRAVASAPAAVLGDEDAQNVFIDSGRDNQAAVPPAPSTTGELIRPSPTPSVLTWRAGGTFVLILLYHYIRYPIPGDRQGFGLSVTPPMFHQQMQYLAANGSHVLSLHDAVQAVPGIALLPY